jgi:hypothetical protein
LRKFGIWFFGLSLLAFALHGVFEIFRLCYVIQLAVGAFQLIGVADVAFGSQ